MTDARNFLLNTDYPLDKIIYITSGSATVANTTNDGVPGITITHNLPFTPLPILLWSNTSDFAICYENSDESYTTNSFVSGAGQFYSVSANSTTIGITRYNLSGSSKTLYYRIFCFQPSNASIESVVPATNSSGSEFILNTDYNYMKLVNAGVLTSASRTYSHGLSFTPRVQLWGSASGTVSRLVGAQLIQSDPTGSAGGTSGVFIDSTKIEWLNPNTFDTIHYRIYGDE
jgi:hypothetical protein